MSQQKTKSPENILKKSQLLGSPTNSKSRLYLPSRYAQQRKVEKIGFQDILNSIQTKTGGDNQRNKAQCSPKLKIQSKKDQVSKQQSKPKTSQFKSRPLKREKSDQLQFNQIFLNPREEALENLKKKSNTEDNFKSINKMYEKLLKFQEDSNDKKLFDQKINEQNKKKINYEQVFEMLQSGDKFGINIKSSQNQFYDNHISIQPPDTPTISTSQSNPGSSYAPSIPSNYKSFKNLNLKQLLMRATAGMNGEDIQKQAHLCYFLGEVYSDKKQFREALKFHKRYLGFAKAMEDVVGMSLGANRVAISYYNCDEVERSIVFHNENLKLSNNQNCFVGFYNIGICYRKLNKLQNALQYFESALNWAQQKGEQQSQCIAFGQIGVTYQILGLYEKSIEYFQKSIQICNKIKKQDLKLHNLRFILRICSMLHLKPIQQIEKIVQQAFVCAQITSGINMLDIFRCNLGIIRGMQQAYRQLNLNQQANQIQEI